MIRAQVVCARPVRDEVDAIRGDVLRRQPFEQMLALGAGRGHQQKPRFREQRA